MKLQRDQNVQFPDQVQESIHEVKNEILFWRLGATSVQLIKEDKVDHFTANEQKSKNYCMVCFLVW